MVKRELSCSLSKSATSLRFRQATVDLIEPEATMYMSALPHHMISSFIYQWFSFINWCHRLYIIIDNQRNFDGTLFNFVVSAVPPDGLAPLGSMIFVHTRLSVWTEIVWQRDRWSTFSVWNALLTSVVVGWHRKMGSQRCITWSVTGLNEHHQNWWKNRSEACNYWVNWR